MTARDAPEPMSAGPLPPPAAPPASWDETIELLEALIDRQTRVLDAGGPDADAIALVTFTPPIGLPPLPEHLGERARRALDATRALVDRAQAMSASVAPARPAARRHDERRAATFDRRV